MSKQITIFEYAFKKAGIDVFTLISNLRQKEKAKGKNRIRKQLATV